MKGRIDLLRTILKKKKLEGLLINNPSNLFYLTGVRLDIGFLLVTHSEVSLFVPSVLFAEARCQIDNFLVKNLGNQTQIEEIANYIRKDKIRYLGVECSISIDLWQRLKKRFKGVNIVFQDRILEEMRCIKDQNEITLIRKSASFSMKTLKHLKRWIKCGKKEWEVCNEIIHFITGQGKDLNLSFEPIVASGKNAFYPHYQLKTRTIREEDVVLVDFGCKYRGYASDLTRMIFLGKIKKIYKDMYDLVLKARDSALSVIKPGVKCSKVDGIARRVMERSGYGKFFIHNLGHGVGIDVHEMPYLTHQSKEVLEEGMVFTIEPGIYISGVGGMRVEDMVLVNKSGCEILTTEKE